MTTYGRHLSGGRIFTALSVKRLPRQLNGPCTLATSVLLLALCHSRNLRTGPSCCPEDGNGPGNQKRAIFTIGGPLSAIPDILPDRSCLPRHREDMLGVARGLCGRWLPQYIRPIFQRIARQALVDLDPHQVASSSGTGKHKSSVTDAAAKAMIACTSSTVKLG